MSPILMGLWGAVLFLAACTYISSTQDDAAAALIALVWTVLILLVGYDMFNPVGGAPAKRNPGDDNGSSAEIMNDGPCLAGTGKVGL